MALSLSIFNPDSVWSLEDIAIRKEKILGGAYMFFMSATYIVDNTSGIFRVHIPKIELPTNVRPGIKLDNISNNPYYTGATIDLGFEELDMHADSNKHLYTVEKIKDKVHEMTLDEIEKKLGYKVKIVNKED